MTSQFYLVFAFGFGFLGTGCSDEPASNPDAGGEAGSSGVVSCAMDPRVDPYTPGLEKPGSQGQLSFELEESTPTPPAKGDNAFVLRVVDGDGAPASVELRVNASMPDHGHSSPSVPVVTFDASTSAYTVTPVDLFMAGVWRIEFDAYPSTEDSATVLDSGVFFFCVEG